MVVVAPVGVLTKVTGIGEVPVPPPPAAPVAPVLVFDDEPLPDEDDPEPEEVFVEAGLFWQALFTQ